MGKKLLAAAAILAVGSFILAAVNPGLYNDIVNWIFGLFQGIGEEAND